MPRRTIDQAALVKSTGKSGNSRNMRVRAALLQGAVVQIASKSKPARAADGQLQSKLR
jgi:hypothetical protein